MKTQPLQRYSLPDLGDQVIHFTGRTGPRFSGQLGVDEAITGKTDQQRLAEILAQGRIRAFETFGSDAPVVCLTESVRVAVLRLIAEGRYTPCGIGFDKDFVFAQGGGPAFYVRGDEWPAVVALPQSLRCRAVRFWPGSELEPGDGSFLPSHLGRSEWLHEREWRVPRDLTFTWADVRFLIVPNESWQTFYGDWIAELWGEETRKLFMAIRTLVIDTGGNIVSDSAGIWAN
jgi:hypothetical protein